MHKILWDFNIETDSLIPARRPDVELVNKKKNYHLIDFDVSVNHRMKIKENKKSFNYLDLAREQKSVELENDGNTSCTWDGLKRL